MSTENNDDRQQYERVGDIVTIYLRGNIWWANYQHENKQVRKSLRTRSRKEARRRAIILEAEILRGAHQRTAKNRSIDAVIEKYQAYQLTERRAEKTKAKVNLVCRRIQELAKVRRARSLADIDLDFVDAYRAARVNDGAMKKTVHNETVIIRQLVNYALRRKLINQDPLAGMPLKRPKPERQPCWDSQQIAEILAAGEGPHRPALILLAETGMRVGELQWLTWEDIDLDRGMMHVRSKEGWRPKTGEDRTFPISAVAKALLKALPRLARWVVTAAPSEKYPDGDHQISERRLLQYLKRVLKKLGLPGHLHTFRHSFISRALANNTSEATVRAWVGQVDPDVLKIYSHVFDEASRAAMEKLDKAAEKKPPEEGGAASSSK